MRRVRLIVLLAPIVLLAGCGVEHDSTPVACVDRAATYLEALADAPAEVRLPGGVPISDCLAENQAGGELAAVGTAMVSAATKLNGEARARPGGDANLRLGYLVGAASRGAEGSAGIHADLIRRLTAAARHSPGGRPLPAAFHRTYRAGYAAGQTNG